MFEKWVKKQIHSLYLNNLLRGIAFSLFGIFVPIYLLTLGYSLQSVFTYFLYFTLATIIFLLLGYSLSKKFGYKAVMIANAPSVIIFITLLQLLETSHIPLSIIALTNGMQNAFFFLPLHGFFSRLSEEKTRGTQVSNFNVFGKLSGLFGPIIGSVIIALFGFPYLFIAATFIMVFSLAPLLYLKNVKPKEKITFKKLNKLRKENKGYFYGTISEKIIGEVSSHIWPIFVFLTLKDILSVGWVGSLITGGTIVFTIIIGKHYDKKSKYFMLRLGSILFAILWIMRFFIESSIFLYASSFFAGFFTLMIFVPFDAIYYDKASRQKSPDSFIIFSEFPALFGRLIIWIIIIFLIKNIETSFLLAALSSVTMVFLKLGAYKKE